VKSNGADVQDVVREWESEGERAGVRTVYQQVGLAKMAGAIEVGLLFVWFFSTWAFLI